jgi:hypothetical protein
VLAFQTYTSYLDLQALFQDLLQRTEIGEYVTDDHEAAVVLETLLQGHPQALKKLTGAEVAPDMQEIVMDELDLSNYRIQTDYHPEFTDTKCFYAVRPDHTRVDFSYHKCLIHLFPLGAARAAYRSDLRSLNLKKDTVVFWQIDPSLLIQQGRRPARQPHRTAGSGVLSKLSALFGESSEEPSLQTSAATAETTLHADSSISGRFHPRLASDLAPAVGTAPSTRADWELPEATDYVAPTPAPVPPPTVAGSGLVDDASGPTAISSATAKNAGAPPRTLVERFRLDDDEEQAPVDTDLLDQWCCEAIVRKLFSTATSPVHIDFDVNFASGLARFFSARDTQLALAAAESGKIPVQCQLLDEDEQAEYWERRSIEILEANSLERRKRSLKKIARLR